jgi:flagellar biogenesis protein FliO
MSQPANNDGAKPAQSAWMSWVAITAVAIVLGLVAPQLMPGEASREKVEPKTEAKEKGKLEYTAPALPDAPSVQSMFVRLGVGTAVVLGLCVATMFGIKKWMYPIATNGTAPREMRLMETLQLGNRCSLHLVHLHKQPILVGVDGSGIQTIVPLPPSFEEVLTEAEAPPLVAGPTAAPKLAA